ncbi:MAG: polysaccharide biosynthesis protein, partial [Pseudonocardia sp.]
MRTAAWIARARVRRPLLLICFDLACWLVAYTVFAGLRYEGADSVAPWPTIVLLALVTAGLQLFVGGLLRIYQGRAKLASLEDSVLLAFVTVGCGAIVSIANAMPEPSWIARTVPPAATFMALFTMGFGRATWRRWVERRCYGAIRNAKPALIFGAGESGRQLVRSMLTSPHAGLRPVGLIDDDGLKKHLRLQGVPVLGTRGDIAAAASYTRASTLVIALPNADPVLIREVAAESREAGLDVKILPGVQELDSQRVSIRDVRDIDVADLLGRNAIETDVPAIAGYLTGKRVLVTGAGGSIGSELCRQIYKYGPAELIMLDRDESALHSVQLSIHGKALLDSDDVVLADIRDVAALRK